MVFGSSWVGLSWETTIEITNGLVTLRSFEYLQIDESFDIPEAELSWVESGEEINSHGSEGPAFLTLTLDEVYEKARTEWLIKQNNTNPRFEATNNGLISLCGYIIEGCQDDCFVRVRITSIEPL